MLSVTLVKGTFVLSLRLFSLGVHASARLDDAGTSVWAFGQVVCSLPEVRRPHSRTPSLHDCCRSGNTGSHEFPEASLSLKTECRSDLHPWKAHPGTDYLFDSTCIYLFSNYHMPK